MNGCQKCRGIHEPGQCPFGEPHTTTLVIRKLCRADDRRSFEWIIIPCIGGVAQSRLSWPTGRDRWFTEPEAATAAAEASACFSHVILHYEDRSWRRAKP